MTSTLEKLNKELLPEVENELQHAVSLASSNETQELHKMLAYHMGWEGEGAGPDASGKRIRPILLLLTMGAAQGEWRDTLPAAAAVELVHNFSLIHDDIEDNSPLRRGRPTLWKLWGVPQAINCGDTMLTLANLSILRLSERINTAIVYQATKILQETCLLLTQGQYLDLSYESATELTVKEYWPMVRGKTAALIGACTELGALIANTSTATRKSYRNFGTSLGMAFQVRDDLLGIWGDADLTGKSTESDLVTGKKSLPVLYGLSQGGAFASRWRKGAILPQEVPYLAQELEHEGARDYTDRFASQYTQHALDSLNEADPKGEFGEGLVKLADSLLNRSR